MRFLHTADWQLGMTRHFLDADAQARFTAARMDVIGRIGELAREQDCEFVLVCGDVFESNALPHRVVARALEAMKEAGVPFYLLPGNHDPLDAASLYDSEEFTRSCPANVYVLRSAEPVRAGGNVQIVAAPWRSKHPAGDPLEEAREQIEDPHHEQIRERVPDQAQDPAQEQPQEHQEQPQEQPGRPQNASGAPPQRIIAGHGAVDVLSPDAQDPALIRTGAWQRLLSQGEVAYVALGDRHSTTEVQQGIAYSGAPEVTDFAETDPGNVLVVELADGRARCTPHQVGTWAFRDLSFTLDSAEDVERMDRSLTELVDKPRTVLRLTLRGTLTLAAHARMEAVLDQHRETFASLQVWQRHSEVAVHVGDEDLVDLDIGGFVADAVAQLASRAAAEGPDRDQARGALTLLYRLAGGQHR